MGDRRRRGQVERCLTADTIASYCSGQACRPAGGRSQVNPVGLQSGWGHVSTPYPLRSPAAAGLLRLLGLVSLKPILKLQ
jgi:hypothetical protein